MAADQHSPSEAPPHSEALWTVEDTAQYLGRTPRAIRGYCAEGKLAAHKVSEPGKPDSWRIKPSSAEEFRSHLAAEGARKGRAAERGRKGPLQADSMLRQFRTLLREELGAQQKGLMPSEQERQARADREQRIEEALGGNVARIEELARENEHLRAELDEAKRKDQAAQEALEAERSKSWWQKLTGRPGF